MAQHQKCSNTYNRLPATGQLERGYGAETGTHLAGEEPVPASVLNLQTLTMY